MSKQENICIEKSSRAVYRPWRLHTEAPESSCNSNKTQGKTKTMCAKGPRRPSTATDLLCRKLFLAPSQKHPFSNKNIGIFENLLKHKYDKHRSMH